jgi:hypothetical protein
MKLNGFIWGALACTLLMPACSNDDDITGAATTDETTNGNLFLNVKIKSASDLTRSAESYFEYGTEDEQTVYNGNFYFYDQSGIYMTNALAWSGIDKTSGKLTGNQAADYPDGTAGVRNNIEFNSNTVVSLAAKKDSYPAYVVTVLNVPKNAQIPTTLNEWKTDMCGADNSFKGIRTSGTDHGFIMSTSSYVGDDLTKEEKDKGWFYVTKLNENNFFKTEAEAVAASTSDTDKDKVVNIYVERLAAKVRVTIDDSKLKPVSGLTDVYALGDDNTAVKVQDGVNNNTRIYIKLLGWGVSATTKDSYLVKHISSDWTSSNTSLGFTWNSTENHRSYWGMSYNYDEGTQGEGTTADYPEFYTTDYKQATGYLTYLASGQLVHGFTANSEYGNIAYCPENTNTVKILKNHIPSAITFVVIKARAVDENGNSVGNIVRYNNVVYTEDNFKSFALASLYTGGMLPMVDDGTDAGRQISANEVEVVDNDYLNGRVDLALKSTANLTFKDTSIDVPTALKSFTLNNTANKYKNGLMYYYVLVRHLRGENVEEAATKDNITEGFYGVVRNHCYNITINDLANLGYGITNAGNPKDPNDPNSDEEPNNPDDPDNDTDPDDPNEEDYPGEPIIPVDEDVDAYFIGANINILSWRTVSQTVAL